MTSTILLLALAYAFVLTVLVIALTLRRIAPWFRIGAALLAVGLFGLTYSQIGELRGLPSDGAPPPFFQLHWARVVEPNIVGQEPGHIFLWLEALDADNYPSGEPRAYVVPYSPDLVRQVEEAMGQIRDGEEVAGEIPTGDEGEEDTGERLAIQVDSRQGENTADGGGVGQRMTGLDFGGMEFVPLPAPVTPVKAD
jgi:hypothetical protein